MQSDDGWVLDNFEYLHFDNSLMEFHLLPISMKEYFFQIGFQYSLQGIELLGDFVLHLEYLSVGAFGDVMKNDVILGLDWRNKHF